jgi:hypothetical protein
MDDTDKLETPQEESVKKRAKRGGHRQRAPKHKVPDEVNKLADKILSNDPDELETENEVEEQQVVERVELGEQEEKSVAPPFQETPSKQAEELEKKPEPIKLEHGNDPYSSYIVQRSESEIYTILESIFGRNDGDFFILNDNVFTRTIEGQPRRFKVSLVEDKHGFRYHIWFNVSRLSLL